MQAGLPVPVAGADNHVETFGEPVDQSLDERGIVLTISVHENENLSGSSPCATLDSCTVAHRVWRRDPPHTIAGADCRGFVCGAVVNNDDLSVRLRLAQPRDEAEEGWGFVLCGQDYADGLHCFGIGRRWVR